MWSIFLLINAFVCFCFHVLFTSPTFTWSCALTRKINSPDGKQDLSDSAAGIGTALVSTSTPHAITASNNNNNNNITCDDNATAPSSPALDRDTNGNGVTGGESSGGGGEGGAGGEGGKWPVKPGILKTYFYLSKSGNYLEFRNQFKFKNHFKRSPSSRECKWFAKLG